MNAFVLSQTFLKLNIIFKVSDLEVGGLLNFSINYKIFYF